MHNEECFDVTIIGGGPAGLYSAFYSGLRELKTKIIEFQPQLGGKVHVYPEKIVWDVGGLLPTPGEKLIESIVEQGLSFDPEVVLGEKVESVQKNEEGIFELTVSSGAVHYSKTVIVAVGSGILQPQKLQIEGAERFEVSNLHYTIQSLKEFKDKTVLISGGGNSAIDWANELTPIAKKVYVSYRKGELKGHEAQVSQLLESSATCLLHTEITKLCTDDGHHIDTVELVNHKSGDAISIDVDEVLINHGFDQDASLLDHSPLPVERKDHYFIAGNENSESSIPGMYAAGDILAHDGKLNLIAGAFQDAANAVNKAKQYIEPNATAKAMVSSHNAIFKEKNKNIVESLVK
ncbi:NAD(P)/FAD-dependent oxidoreductase [Pontibacillus sp. ALD_SL1]|uniref:NAD(P)/FAD-dependent oxidoreductase n=1 Tax=Pontibacillus sp. ALD_SL1 TaxID=2777185 RepID=UPI001A97A2E6|nr:NAD(P)/FAD-dependent oxidoreductase [Pontibacillus sp. ALD_SL1]QST01242.1 NAD(P)/FAD-dependent oxidoreductase [Pontibacillus sp. ALD_SL1]